jgi:hypothetical protein
MATASSLVPNWAAVAGANITSAAIVRNAKYRIILHPPPISLLFKMGTGITLKLEHSTVALSI